MLYAQLLCREQARVLEAVRNRGQFTQQFEMNILSQSLSDIEEVSTKLETLERERLWLLMGSSL